jgi:CDP-6-deoxy-D-xylo-4-hexulose-3-dehydrase
MQISNNVDCSWFAFPIIVNKQAPFSKKDINDFLEMNGVETRPVVAGNLARQPGVALFSEISFDALGGADFIHKQGFYLGIHPTSHESYSTFK